MAPKLLKNGTVLSFDGSTSSIKVVRQASILILEGRITAIVEQGSDLELPSDTEVIDVTSKIISPGFINTHMHTWMTAMRTVAPNVTLAHYFHWIDQHSQATNTGFGPKDIYVSSLEGYAEGINGGVTTYIDHAHSNWSPEVMRAGYDAAIDSGARTYWCYQVGNREGFPMEAQWKAYEEVAAAHRSGEALVQLGLGYDELMDTLPGELTHTKDIVDKYNVQAITSHFLGGAWPGGCDSPRSPYEVCESHLSSTNAPLVVSHAGFLTEKDMDALREHNVHISITPESEFHYGHGQTTGHLVSDKASLGIDTSFTFSGDVLTQARLWLQTVRHTNYLKVLDRGELPIETPMTVEQGFLLGTRQGGLALHRKDLGVIQVGAKADLVVFDGDSPNMLGWSDPVAAVMLHANVGDIEHVLVDGEWRKRNFKLIDSTVPWEELKVRFLDTARRVHAAAQPPTPVPKKLWGFADVKGAVDVVSTIPKVK